MSKISPEARKELEEILTMLKEENRQPMMLGLLGDHSHDPMVVRILSGANERRIRSIEVALGGRPTCVCGGDDTGPEEENNSGLSHIPTCPVSDWLDEQD